MSEITLEFVLNTINKRIDDLQTEIKGYHASFVAFEEGKLTQALQDIEKNKGDIVALKKQNEKQNDINIKDSERRKEWIWETVKTIVFMLIVPLIGLILVKTGIINLH